jgi:hypothetical protein
VSTLYQASSYLPKFDLSDGINIGLRANNGLWPTTTKKLMANKGYFGYFNFYLKIILNMKLQYFQEFLIKAILTSVSCA